MEEQKNKEVKLGANQDNKATQKEMPTFDELYQAYMDLAQKHQRAIQQLQQADKYIQTFNRLDYLFKVVEIANNYRASDYPCFDNVFVEECLKEIQEIMTIPEEDNKKVFREN